MEEEEMEKKKKKNLIFFDLQRYITTLITKI